MANELALPQPNEVPPRSRIGTASNATAFVLNLINADQQRAMARTRVKGQYDGNAPFSKAELASKGMAGATNLNFRQSTALIDQFKTPYYDLVTEVPMLANIVTSYGKSEERADWSQTISEAFHKTVTDWSEWDFTVQFHQFQMLLHGIGPVWFKDGIDWRPEVGRTGEILWQDDARCNMQDITALAILHNYLPTRLYDRIKNEPQAATLGWNIKAVETAICEASANTQPTGTNMYEWYQQQFKNADIYWGSMSAAMVRTANVLVSEFGLDGKPGRVSHHIVRTDSQQTEFLFSKLNRYPAISDMIVPFFYDIGDGTIHSINGMGKNIFAYVEIFNRLRCREVDGAMIAASLLLQSKDSTALTKQQLLEIGNLRILPSNVELKPLNMGDGIDATVSVRRDMENSLAANIGSVNRPPNQANPRKGQQQAIMEMQQAGALKKGEIARYYTTFDKLLALMYRRMSNPNITANMPGGREALAFQEYCFKRGVPPQALAEIDSVKAFRSIGAGSVANAMQNVDWLMANIQSYTEAGKLQVLRIATSRMIGTDMTNAIMGDASATKTVTSDQWAATIENGLLRTGGEPPITQLQSAVIHLEVHLADAGQHYQQVNEAAQQGGGMDPKALQDLDTHLLAAGVHCKKHLDTIANDPIREQDFKRFRQEWQDMSRLADQVAQQLSEMEQAQAQQSQQSGSDPTDVLKLLQYKDAPESVKAQIEQAVGIQRSPGDESVTAQNLRLKAEATALKAQKQQQQSAHDDVRLAQEIQQNGAENELTPARP